MQGIAALPLLADSSLDAKIRARILRGSEDSLVNFVLFGTSFTAAPRGDVGTRIHDFALAVQRPGNNERLIFLASLLRKLGHTTPSDIGQYVTASVARVQAEMARYDQGLASNNPDLRSQAYRARGLSADTSIRPCYALDATWSALDLGTPERLAVIGPGLDFADKNEGLDYYPLQTIQPFAAMETIRSLKSVTAFDINPQCLAHLRRARQSSRYRIELTLDRARRWSPELRKWWQSFGSILGREVAALPVPSGLSLDTRAVEFPRSITRRLQIRDLNIVTDRFGVFDVILATNILVYYDASEQSLAMTNIAGMLPAGGLFLTNDYVAPSAGLKLLTTRDVIYSDVRDDEDRIYVYVKSAFAGR